MSSYANPRAHHDIQIGIADRHPIFRTALAELVAKQLPGAQLTDNDMMLEDVLSTSPQVLLLDIHLPELGGLFGLLRVAKQHPDVHIIAVCDDLPRDPQQLLMYGAMAGITKSQKLEHFIEAIRIVSQGKCWLPAKALEHPYCELHPKSGLPQHLAKLSPRRKMIVNMVADGLLNKQIAYELGLCESTIKAHISQIMKVLRVRNRTQIATAANSLRERSPLNLSGGILPNIPQHAFRPGESRSGFLPLTGI